MSGALEGMSAELVQVNEWLEQISRHLAYLERRAMAQDILGHELLRQFMQVLREWCPTADLSWGYRSLEDWAQKGVRRLIALYSSHAESLDLTAQKAYIVVRVILEEAFHRNLIACGGEADKLSGMCALMLTLRNIEAVKAQDAVKLALPAFASRYSVPAGRRSARLPADRLVALRRVDQKKAQTN